ncbi:hypothetical protein [Crateriforma conspicua]|uniref:Uncharacterized protein n=1 Tax=Crateriforma conspicua TaxID=2527996 RepID=A0A5C5Y8G4_9PLAN|nr:hypothetical protein [Crateriforma conspicua]QDV65869.1 hypothetical protein Mal65_50420 [Crateriforma conspicua]TWT71269.1 hypothetical protein Pan14r_35790 [Crateriforma conspicua]
MNKLISLVAAALLCCFTVGCTPPAEDVDVSTDTTVTETETSNTTTGVETPGSNVTTGSETPAGETP